MQGDNICDILETERERMQEEVRNPFSSTYTRYLLSQVLCALRQVVLKGLIERTLGCGRQSKF